MRNTLPRPHTAVKPKIRCKSLLLKENSGYVPQDRRYLPRYPLGPGADRFEGLRPGGAGRLMTKFRGNPAGTFPREPGEMIDRGLVHARHRSRNGEPRDHAIMRIAHGHRHAR